MSDIPDPTDFCPCLPARVQEPVVYWSAVVKEAQAENEAMTSRARVLQVRGAPG